MHMGNGREGGGGFRAWMGQRWRRRQRERERERGGHTKEDIPKVERERERERNGDRRPQSEAAQDMQIANHPYLHYYTTALAGFRCPAEGGGREEEGET